MSRERAENQLRHRDAKGTAMDRTFDKRLVIGIGLVVGLMAVNAGLTYENTHRLNRDAVLVAHTHEVLDLASETLRTLVDAETGERGFLIHGKDEYLQPYDAARKRLDGLMETLQEKTADNPAQQKQIKRLQGMTIARMKLLQEAIDVRRNGADGEAALIASRKGKAQMDAIRELIAEMERREHDLLQERQSQSRRTYVVAQTSALLTAALGLLMVGAFCWQLGRSLTARQKAAAILDEQREWFRTTLASIGDAVIATDTGGRVTFLNAVAQALTGWKEEEALGAPLETVFKIVNEESRRSAANPAVRALQEGTVVGLANHTLLLSRHGTELPIDDSASPIQSSNGHVAGVVLVFRDVTERRRAEAEREQQTVFAEQRAESLADADRRKNEFLAMLAHELRNPLAPIRNALHLVQMQAQENNGELREPLAIIERQVEALVRLVDDLLDVSRITRGKIKLQMEPVDVGAIVTRAIESSRPLIDARRHKLDVSLPNDRLVVKADVTRMAQVALNLLNNAAKYTPEGGHIWLTVERAGGDVTLRVRDNGMGIPADMLPKVFDLFTQSERTLDRAEGGLGIGLTLVRRLTEMHDGSAAAFSDGPGLGSEFVVRLPLLPDSTRIAAPAKGPAAAGRGKSRLTRRVLVVDDNRDAADSLAMLLRLVGHDVRTVHDGRQALAVVESYRPDLVLLDIGLPGMDGNAVARQIRSQPELAGTVLVALTGYGSEEDRRASQAAGFNHHMVKPADFVALQTLLDSLAPPENTSAAGCGEREVAPEKKARFST
jgi:PAS domain S-box-containing protein